MYYPCRSFLDSSFVPCLKGQWATAIIFRQGYSDEQVKQGFKVPICLVSGTERECTHGRSLDEEAMLGRCRLTLMISCYICRCHTSYR